MELPSFVVDVDVSENPLVLVVAVELLLVFVVDITVPDNDLVYVGVDGDGAEASPRLCCCV